jgi:hypothetical protein
MKQQKKQDDNPTHKHTHLQDAQSQRTDQSLQKSVLFATLKRPATKATEKGAADNSSLAKWRV